MVKLMKKMKERVMGAMKWLVQVHMTAIGEEDLGKDKVNFGIKMEQYNMMENGNVENLMVKGKFTINGVIYNMKESSQKVEPKEENIGQTSSIIGED
jgi:hypothetical protein